MPTKILLAGGYGFIGKNIREQLENKYIFFSPTHQELDFLDSESVEKYFRKYPVDVVIYALSVGGTRKTKNLPNVLDTNLKCFYNVVNCRKYFKKIIFFGSGAEYDKRFPIVNVKESDFGKNIPIDEYGLYKYTCSEYIQNNSNIINLRLFGVFGKYENYEIRFISQAICKNILNLPITIKQNVYFDYLYINDLVKIVDYFILNKSHYNVYNVGRGEKLDLLTIAKTINKIAPKSSPIVIKNPGLQNEYTSDNKRLMGEIKDLRFTPFEKSLRDLYSWYKSIKPELRKTDIMYD